MKLTWYGHSCFAVESDYARVIFDPYAPGSVPGCTLPPLCADLVLCSHSHADHSYKEGVSLSGKNVDVKLFQLDTFHDDANGTKRGKNIVSVIELDGVRVAHFGDLGHMLNDDEIRALGKIDIMLIPVGGFYTINAKTAAVLTEKIKPTAVVPMHYRGKDFGYNVIAAVDEFARLFDKAVILNSSSFEFSAETTNGVIILKKP